MHIVILAEKPNQAKDISQIFKNVKRNNGYYEITDNDFFPNASVTLTYGIGHLVGLALPTAYDKNISSGASKIYLSFLKILNLKSLKVQKTNSKPLKSF